MNRSLNPTNALTLARLSLLTALAAAGSAATAHAAGFDATFNGNYAIDAFAGSPDAQRVGGKLARLPDGDIVVAGRMRHDADPVAPYWNVGLVRYAASGQRRTWNAVAPWYANHFGQYVVYPNPAGSGDSAPHVESVDAIAYAAGRLYVLVTHYPAYASVNRDVAVLVFDTDGRLIERQAVTQTPEDETGAALDATATRLVTRPVSLTVLLGKPQGRIAVARLNQDYGGNVEPDRAFGTLGIAQPELMYPACSVTCDLTPVDLVRPFRFSGNAAPIFVAASLRDSYGYFDPVVIKLSADGLLDDTFNRFNIRPGRATYGALRVAFDQPGQRRSAQARALHTETSGPFGQTSDRIWLVADVAQSCKPGVGLARISERGVLDRQFGGDGLPVYGGDDVADERCERAASHSAGDIAGQGEELAVAATTRQFDPATASVHRDGALLRVDKTSGVLRGLDPLVQQESGLRSGNSNLRGIVPSQDGGYYVSGTGDHYWYGTLYLAAKLHTSD